ncbi:MAG: hypothetical protein ABL949_05945 [Fimbriimonadaceae bacterium]
MDFDRERARYRFTAQYRFTPRFQAGFEYNAAAHELAPIANWVLTPESEKIPMISANVSSDRLGTPKGPMSYGVTFAKGFQNPKIAPYFSVRYSEYEHGLNFPFGVNIQLNNEWSLMPMNDGRKSHVLLTYTKPDFSVSLMLIWLKHPGISISWGF